MRSLTGTDLKPSDETFVEIWTKGHLEGWTLEETAARLNMKPSMAYHYSRKLCAAGVKLPLLSGQKRRPANQIRKLNAIVTSVMNGKES